MNQNIAELSNESKKLHERLAESEVGETVEYDELSTIVGFDIRDKRHLLDTARRLALHNEGMVFDAVTGVGIKRLNDQGIINVAAKAPTKVRRTVRKAALIATKVDFDALSNTDKQRHNATLSICGVLAQMTKPNKLKEIEKKVSTASAMSFKETLSLFQSVKPKH